jgi:hypothetical protein
MRSRKRALEVSGIGNAMPDDEQQSRSAWKAAFGALIGLRRREDFERDAAGLKPKQLIIIALALITMFVGGVLTLVHFVLH